MIAQSLTTIILLAVIVEVLTNSIKAVIPSIKEGHKKNGSRVASAVVGVTLCITTRVGILTNLNIFISYEIIDFIITGIIISRGANAVHDIISVFENKLV
ncbi:hypothetical protein [Natronospora cellulosivora (SeqCode)]